MTASTADLAPLPGPILGLSAAAGSAAGLAQPGGAAHRALSEAPRSHVETMIPLVRTVLEEAGLAPAGLAAIAVGRGPAPYTGLRIGLMTAQTLGFALGIPVWGVCDLDVLAADAAIRLGLEVGQSLLAALDAKRREVYWASYRVDAAGQVDGLVRLEGPAVSAPAAVPPAAIAIGPGVALYPEALGPVAGQVAGVDPVVLARLAAARAARGQDVTSRPLYLRRPQVAAPAPAKRATP